MTVGITGVILNWKRPANVTRILDGWRASGLVTEALVWNNNPALPFHHDWARVINANQDFGLYTRFAATCLATHDCILIQDDDLELPRESLAALLDAWKADSDIIHGVFGRIPKPDGSYARDALGDAGVPIVLTRVLLVHQRYASAFFEVAHSLKEIQRDGRPNGNGEDIILSYTVMKSTGRLNRIHRLEIVELPAPHSIHNRNWSKHLNHRTRVLRACETWLKGEIQ